MCNDETRTIITELRRMLDLPWSPESLQQIHPAAVALLDVLRGEEKEPSNSPEHRLVNLIHSTKEPKQ